MCKNRKICLWFLNTQIEIFFQRKEDVFLINLKMSMLPSLRYFTSPFFLLFPMSSTLSCSLCCSTLVLFHYQYSPLQLSKYDIYKVDWYPSVQRQLHTHTFILVMSACIWILLLNVLRRHLTSVHLKRERTMSFHSLLTTWAMLYVQCLTHIQTSPSKPLSLFWK